MLARLGRALMYRISCAASLLALVMLPGCAGGARAPYHGAAPSGDVHASLVLPAPALVNVASDADLVDASRAPWEFARNNAAVNVRPFGALYPYGWTEIYTRDRFTTHGTHAHEYSRYEIRSYRVR